MKNLARIVILLVITVGVRAQVQPPPAPWRGAGPTPCVGSDGGVTKCAPAGAATVIRAGRLFDSKTGQIRTRQVIVIEGEKITAVGAEGQVKAPSAARVIDLSSATVLPGLIDAHTHMRNSWLLDEAGNRPRSSSNLFAASGPPSFLANS